MNWRNALLICQFEGAWNREDYDRGLVHMECSNQTDLYHPQEAAYQIWVSAY
jgi:hypothetical protein